MPYYQQNQLQFEVQPTQFNFTILNDSVILLVCWHWGLTNTTCVFAIILSENSVVHVLWWCCMLYIHKLECDLTRVKK